MPPPVSARAVQLLLGTLLGLIVAVPSFAQFGQGDLPIAMPIDIETVQLDGRFLRNGTLFGDDYLDGGIIKVESDSGERTTLGLSWDQSYGPLQLIAGRYTPTFSSLFESPTAPRANDQLFSAPVDLLTDQVWNPDVGAVLVNFSFLLNGASFPGSADEIADFYLRDVETEREIHIGTSQDGRNSFFIVPGTYDVFYAYRSGLLIPENKHARVLENVEISADMPLVVDVPLVNRSFFYFLDGEAFPADPYAYGMISLENPETGDSLYLGNTYSPDFVHLIPGTYQVSYSFREGFEQLPINPSAIVEEALTIAPTGSTTVDIEVTSHFVEPSFLIDGGPSDFGNYDYGYVYVESRQGDRLRLGDTHADPEPRRIVAGTYDAYYQYWTGADATPRNLDTRFVENLVIDTSGPLVLDIQTALFTLELELNGGAFPEDQYESARIRIVDPHSGSEIDLGPTHAGPLTTLRLIRGRYDIVYEWREGGSEVPVNRRHVIAHDLLVDQSGAQTIDVRTRTISPGFALNGDPFPESASDYGEFFLRDPDGDEIPLGASNSVPMDRIVIEGAYAVQYEWREGEDVPINERETLEIRAVPEARFAQGLILGILLLGVLRQQSASRCRNRFLSRLPAR